MANLFEKGVTKDTILAWAKKVVENEPTYYTKEWDATAKKYGVVTKTNTVQYVLAIVARTLAFQPNDGDKAQELNEAYCELLMKGCVGFMQMKPDELAQHIFDEVDTYGLQSIGEFAETMSDIWKVVAV